MLNAYPIATLEPLLDHMRASIALDLASKISPGKIHPTGQGGQGTVFRSCKRHNNRRALASERHRIHGSQILSGVRGHVFPDMATSRAGHKLIEG